MNDFTVYKLNHRGETALSYSGDVVSRGANYVCVRACFSFGTMELGYVTLKPGDLFTEWFYSDRWYNVFRVQDVDTGMLKGFYCNLTRPAIIEEDHVSAEDLELDVFVRPDGSILLLDEDDYEMLCLPTAEHNHVQAAVEHIYELVRHSQPPFSEL